MKKLLCWLLCIPCTIAAQNTIIPISPNDLGQDGQRYEELLKEYNRGNKDFSTMPFLVNKSKELKRNELAMRIAHDYIENYLMKLGNEKLLTKANINFIRFNIGDSKGKAFVLFYKEGDKIDQVMNEIGYAKDLVQSIITKELLDPVIAMSLKEKQTPDWDQIGKSIREKYNEDYSARILLDGKIKWFYRIKDWPQYSSNVVTKVEQYGPFGMYTTDFKLNNIAWDLFLYSNNKVELAKALAWSDSAVKINPIPNWMDTKANLLYKLGRVKEAIALEEKAAALAGPTITDILDNLEKMKKGTPTWPIH